MARNPKSLKRNGREDGPEAAKAFEAANPRHKKPGTKPKYSLEIKTQAMILWASGHSMREIKEMLGLSSLNVVDRWKQQDIPLNWAKMREKIQSKQVTTTITNTMDTIEEIRAKQQNRWEIAQNASLSFIGQMMKDKKFNHSVAADILFRAADYEQRLHLPLEVAQAPRGNGMAVGAFAKSTGEIGVMVALNQMWEERHGRPSQGGTTVEPAGEPLQQDGLPDPKDV